MATEKILMACVERGESRQEMHEIIREYSVEAGAAVKNEGVANDLLERLGKDERVPFDQEELNGLLGNYQEFTGRAAEQTQEYLQEVVHPLLDRYKDELRDEIDSTLSV
ncbi:MAG: hypothetical protein CSA26_01895 [Desulfobacterales bacterium]|nr:MAG: hypothetical protein CSA26_01895 [Desulfobacterales bacterium]